MPAFWFWAMVFAWFLHSLCVVIAILLDLKYLALGFTALYWLWKILQWSLTMKGLRKEETKHKLLLHLVLDLLGLLTSSLSIGLLELRLSWILVSSRIFE